MPHQPHDAGLHMSEKELLSSVLDLCSRLRLRAAHFPPLLTPDGRWITSGQGDAKGFPDLVIVGPGGVLFAELKTDTGRVEPAQRMWLDALAAGAARVRVWRVRDWRSGAIARDLQALNRSAAGERMVLSRRMAGPGRRLV